MRSDSTLLKTLPTLALCLALGVLLAPALEAQPSALKGLVTNSADEPLRDVRITATLDGDSTSVATAESNKKGRFELKLPGGGTYEIRFEKDGYDPYVADLDVEANTTQEISLRMPDIGEGAKQEAIKLVQEGSDAYQGGDLDTAKQKFLTAIEKDPELPAPHLYLADIYLREDNGAESAKHFEAYLPSDPENLMAWRVGFGAYRAAGNTEGVARAVDKLVGTASSKDLASRTYNEGVEKSRKGDIDGALADFDLALKLSPELTAVHIGRAALLLNEDRYPEAVEAAKALLEVKPDSVQGRRIRYLALGAQTEGVAPEDVDAALAAWAEVDADGVAKQLLEQAEADREADNTAAAVVNLERLLGMQPDHAEAHYQLGLAYAAQGKADQAKQHLARFLELAPSHAEAAAAREMMQGL